MNTKPNTKVYVRPPELPKNNEDSLTWVDTIEGRKISRETLLKYDVRFTQEKIYFPFYENDVLVNSKSVDRFRPNGKKKIWFTPNCKNVLFGMNTVQKGWRTLFIAEGELCSMSLHDMGFKNCVSVPNGADSHTWLDNCQEFLQEFKEIFIIFDADDAGRKGAENLKTKLPSNIKSSIVNITNLFTRPDGEDCIDINDLHMIGERDFIKKMVKISRDPREENLIKPTDCTESMQREYLEGSQSIASTGFECLDKFVFGKGAIRQKEISVITASAGSGKSEFCNNMAINIAKQKVGVFFASFEQEDNAQLALFNNCLTGKDYGYIEDLQTMSNKKRAKEIEIGNLEGIKNTNEWLQLNGLLLHNYGDTSDPKILDRLFSDMEYSAQTYNSRVFILDPVSIVMDLESSNSAQSTRRFILKVKEFAIKYKAHVFLVMHPKKTDKKDVVINESMLFGSSMIFNFIHNFFSIWRFVKTDDDKTVAPRMLNTIRFFCFKNRKRGELRNGSTQLYFDVETKRYSEIKTFESGGMVDFVETSVPVFMDNFDNYSGTMKRYSKDIIEEDLKDLKESYIQANDMGDE